MMKKLKSLMLIGIFSINSFSFNYTDEINKANDHSRKNVWGPKIEKLKEKLKDLEAYRISSTDAFKNYAKKREDELEEWFKKLEDESKKYLKDLESNYSDLNLCKTSLENQEYFEKNKKRIEDEKKSLEDQKKSLENEYKNYVKKKEDKLQEILKDISDKENTINNVITMYREIIQKSRNSIENTYHGYSRMKEEKKEIEKLYKKKIVLEKILEKNSFSSIAILINEIDEEIKKKQDKIDEIKKHFSSCNEKTMNMIKNYRSEIDKKDLNIDSITSKELTFTEEIRQIMMI